MNTKRATLDEYWTTERMEAAVPVDIGDPTADEGAAESTTAPQLATGKPTIGSEPVTVGASITVSATKVVGKVFFTGSDGKDYVCSASSVNSANKNMIFTAGHCVHGGPGKSWATNWQYVPYYDHGKRPYGTWRADWLISFNGWMNDGDFGYDLGIVIATPLNGTELVDAVGGLGIQWNYGKERYMTAMGYPASYGFDGQWQYYCAGTTSQRSSSVTDQIKIPCNMTGGSSGGPWIYGKDDNVYYSGYVNGVNSNVPSDEVSAPTVMRSPYFATWVGDAFNKYSSW
ncbi:trypsin-like serine peptidase [Streptomyces sp. NPDC001020]